MSMPKQKPGRSKQDYGTPPALLAAVKHRLCIKDFSVDLAASQENAVTSAYFDEAFNSLREDVTWNVRDGHWAWLNPPFANIEPWVRKASQESFKGAHIAMLVPSSVGSDWWLTYVEAYAYQSHLNGRLKFVGCEDYYPKDCSLLLYTPWGFFGHEIWDWRRQVPKPVPELQQPELGED